MQNISLNNQSSSDKVQKETEAAAEISALVNYVQPVHFSSFDVAESMYFKYMKIDITSWNM